MADTTNSVSATPPTPTTVQPKLNDQVKSSTPQYIIFDNDNINESLIVDLLFENLSSHEILDVARNDNINGQKVFYNPIKNLVAIQEQFNPNNILKLQGTADEYFKNYPIKLNEKVPNVGNGTNGSNVYLDTNGNLIVETVNTSVGEQVEIQIALGGTIYEVNL